MCANTYVSYLDKLVKINKKSTYNIVKSVHTHSCFAVVWKVRQTVFVSSTFAGVQMYIVNHKKRDILFLTLTLANLNWFFMVFISF